MRVLSVLSHLHARLAAALSARARARSLARSLSTPSANVTTSSAMSNAAAMASTGAGTTTLRGLFYSRQDVFARQSLSDAAVADVAALLRVPRAALGVAAGARGAVYGPLTIAYDAEDDDNDGYDDDDDDNERDPLRELQLPHQQSSSSSILSPPKPPRRRCYIDCSAAPVVVSERFLRNPAFFGPGPAVAAALEAREAWEWEQYHAKVQHYQHLLRTKQHSAEQQQHGQQEQEQWLRLRWSYEQ